MESTAINVGRWRKSRHSQSVNDCVEVAPTVGEGFAVRDSKLGPSSPVLFFGDSVRRAFVAGVKAGEFG